MMQQLSPDTWLMPDSLQVDVLLTALSRELSAVAAPEYSATVVYADSFDWRLFRQGFILHCHGRAWTLYHGDSGAVTVQLGGPELKRSCFARDFPSGLLREQLEPLLAIRCLLPLARVHMTGRQVRLLNRDEKTVARIVFEEQSLSADKPVVRMLRLFCVRGYDQELASVRRILSENGVSLPVSPLISFEEGCKEVGRWPLDYSSKFDLQLDAGRTAGQAMVGIYQHLLTAVTRNVSGVLEDLDTEFLHDFRVAIRRIRSGLSLVKNVLPPAIVNSFKNDISQLGSLTGPTRDLDVYLLKQGNYLARLPATLQPGLATFFAGLVAQREVEHKKMVRALRSKKSRAILNTWTRYFASKNRGTGSADEMAAGELAGQIILRRFKRVMRDGKALDAATPDPEIHRLRIQCKKLRYAIEFFGSLYPAEKIQQVVRQLKKLQDILGTFNDLSVQQQMVSHTLDGLRGSRPNNDLVAALGALMQSLYQEQQKLRGNFSDAFTQFSDPSNTALFNGLFRSNQET